MKKLLIFFSIFVLCGCTRNVICTDTIERGKNTFTDYYDITVVNNKVTDISYIQTYNKEKVIEQLCGAYKLTYETNEIICEDNKITIKDYQVIDKVEGYTKKEIIKFYEDKGYTCKAQ